MSRQTDSMDKLAQRINNDYTRIGQKHGFGVQYMGLETIGPFTGGTFGRLNHVFTSNKSPDIYSDTNFITFTAHGLAAAVLSEPMKCYCAVLVEKPVPASIYVKQIRDGFRKKPIWVPYNKTTKASDVFKNKMNWNSLVDALNNDSHLGNLMGKLRTETNVNGIDQNLNVGRRASFPVKVNDDENNHGTSCMIIPMGERTLIASQHATQDPKDIEPAIQAVQRIAQIVTQYNYQTPTTGPMISDYAEDLLKKMQKTAPQPTPKPAPAPTPTPAPAPTQSGVICPECGASNPADNKFCGECGATLKSKTGVCPKCGAENPPENKFCGECGALLAETSTLPPPPPKPSDPVEQLIAEIEGGTDAQWTIRYKTTEQEYEGRLWNIANKGYFVRHDDLMEVAERISKYPHYQLFPNIKYVKSPNDKTITGGFMNFATGFNESAQEPFKDQFVQVLLLPRDDNPAETSVRMLASSDKEMNPDLFAVMLDILVNHPARVSEFYLWGIQD